MLGSMSMRRLAIVIVAAALLGGCKKEAKDSGKDPAPEIEVEPIALTVDGEEAGMVDAAKAGLWAPLGNFLPSGKQNLETWASIVLEPAQTIPASALSPTVTDNPLEELRKE